MTLKQFFDIFKRRLREQSGTAVPVIEVIGDSKRIRVGTCMSHTNTLTFDEKKTNHWPLEFVIASPATYFAMVQSTTW